MKVTIDFETRGTIDLVKCGIYKYARDANTSIMCLALKVDNAEPLLWIPKKFRHLNNVLETITDNKVNQIIKEASVIEAHYVEFENCIWTEIMHKRFNFPQIANNKLRCSAAKAATLAIPRQLGEVGTALNLPIQKDLVGRRIMLKMCKPRKPRKAEKLINPNWENTLYWCEDQEDFVKLCEYCMKDVTAEYELSKNTFELTGTEYKIWKLDQLINRRGIRVDENAINNIVRKIKIKEETLRLECQKITKGQLNSTTQVTKTIEWLSENGLEIPNLQKDTVANILKKRLPKNVRKILQIKQSLGKSSVKKFNSMLDMLCEDHRIRGSLLYHGARTGRWSGKGIQPHNYPRNSFKSKDIDFILNNGVDLIEIIYGCIRQASSKCLRGMFIPEKNKIFYGADFTSIEAMVLSWLAKEDKVLDAFRNKLDIYKIAVMSMASLLFNANNLKYDEITEEQRQIGKVATLALGYQGFVGAFQAMAPNYGLHVSDDKAKEIAMAWRKANPNIVKYWKDIEKVAIKAIETGRIISHGNIKYGIRNRFLHCRLPSGRLLSYAYPATREIENDYGQKKKIITFWGVGSDKDKMLAGKKQWGMIGTYGGKLVENITQAVARDLLAEAMLRIEKEGYRIVLHVHDEILTEVNENFGSIEHLEKIISIIPSWAKGIPLSAKGWKGVRYGKY